jgi:RHS repeat-associated protein
MTTIPKPADPTAAFYATYDAWNRLVKTEEDDGMSGTWKVAEYAYDGAMRRSVKEIYASGSLDETRHFFYTEPNKWQVVEERVDSSSSAERQFVWGLRYVDDLIGRDRDTTGDGLLDERLYATQDANWNVTSLFTGSGTALERFNYDSYGSSTALTATFDFRGLSSYEWGIRYSGYRSDAESSLLSVRNRVYHPRLGWIQRDPAKYTDTLNLYEYVGSQPLIRSDPTGEFGPIGQCIIGGAIGGIIGSLVSLFSSWVGGEGPCQTKCKALVNGMAGALAGCVGAGLVNPCLATVIANFGASLASTLCDAYCGCPQNIDQIICSLAFSLVTSALSCMGIAAGSVTTLPPPLDEIYEALIGVLASVAGGSVGTAGTGLCGFFS